MKLTLIILSVIIAVFIGRQLGLWILACYKLTGGVIMAADIIGLRYIMPITIGGLAAYCVWDLLNRKK